MSLIFTTESGKKYRADPQTPDQGLEGYLILKSSPEVYDGKSRPTKNKAPLFRQNGNVLAGLPDVWNWQEMSGTKVPDYIPMTEDLQHYFLWLNITRYKRVRWSKEEYFAWFHAGGAEVRWAAGQLTGALTHDRSHANNWGMDNGVNFLTGETNRDGLPMFMKILTGWARLKLYNGKTELKNVAGVGTCVAFHAINASQDYWRFNSWDHMDKMDEPCITGRVVDYTPKNEPFIAKDGLHYPFEAFGGRLIFPKLLPQHDKGFYLYSGTRLPKAGEQVWKFQP